ANPLLALGNPSYSDPGCQIGGIVFPWRLYQNYADIRMLSEHYDSASKWFGYLAHNCTNTSGAWLTTFWGTSTVNVGDWTCGSWMNDPPSGWTVAPSHGYACATRTTWGTAWSGHS